MARYRCAVCGYMHDEQKEGSRWNDLPDGWACPICASPKSVFAAVDRDASGAAAGPIGRFAVAHRIFGYVFLLTYLWFLWHMVPRLWTYQIEFPARTVVHIVLGMAIGAVLLLKIMICRFFPRLEASLVPSLGTSLFVGTVLLIGISAPFAFREAALGHVSGAAGLFAPENLERLDALLAQAGLEDPGQRSGLVSRESLRAGRNVLIGKCTQCHDLRTVLARPRTPDNWRQTVRRMAERTSVLDPIDQHEQWQVTAYLIALSPQLQRTVQEMRDQQQLAGRARQAADAVRTESARPPDYDARSARQLFETKCSQCHATSLVETRPPRSPQDARDLVARMIDEGLSATEEELGQIVQYLTSTFAKDHSP